MNNHKAIIIRLSLSGTSIDRYTSIADADLARKHLGERLYPAKIEVLSLLSEKIREELGNVT